MAEGTEGFVYVLKNEAMPGYVKIGLTQQADVAERVRQLDTTATPLPFEVFYVAKVPDCRSLERTLHFVFGEKRVRRSREFFTCDPDLVKAIIELVAIKEEALTDTEQDISPQQRTDIEATKRSRSERMDLEKLGLAVGTPLAFSKDPQITCSVAGPRTVLFRGQTQSLSQAALTVIHEMGYQWPTVSGWEYWTLNGVKLADLQPLSALTAEPPA